MLLISFNGHTIMTPEADPVRFALRYGSVLLRALCNPITLHGPSQLSECQYLSEGLLEIMYKSLPVTVHQSY